MTISFAAVSVLAFGVMFGTPGASYAPAHAGPAVPQERVFTSERRLPTNDGLVYVSSAWASIVYVFALQGSNPFPIATILDGIGSPLGMTLDAKGTLYVINETGTLAEYPKGSIHPSKVIRVDSQPGAELTDVAVDASGVVYVSANEAGTVTEFRPGESKPFRTITGLDAPSGIALDKHGDLFIADERFASFGCIWKVKAGATKAEQLPFKGIIYPFGLVLDSQARIYVSYPGPPSEVYVYKQGQDTPVRTITNGLVGPWMMFMTPHNDLFIANNGANEAIEYPPGGSTPYQVFTNDVQQPSGVAELPPAT